MMFEAIEELRQNRLFKTMSNSVDEDEHSIEMHLPYTYKMFERQVKDEFIVNVISY